MNIGVSIGQRLTTPIDLRGSSTGDSFLGSFFGSFFGIFTYMSTRNFWKHFFALLLSALLSFWLMVTVDQVVFRIRGGDMKDFQVSYITFIGGTLLTLAGYAFMYRVISGSGITE